MEQPPVTGANAVREPNAGVFDASLPGGKTTGWLRIRRDVLEFTSVEQRTWEMPLLGLKITRGGVGNRYWFLQNAGETTFFTDDPAMAAELQACVGYPEVVIQMAQWRRESHRGLAMAGGILLALASVILGLWLSRGLIADAITARIPAAAEEKLGQLGVAQWEKLEGENSTDTEAVQQLEALCQPLLAALPKNDYRFHFYLSKSKEINAAALPGGYIIVNTGLVEAASTPEEIQGVLAHELGHVVKRHTVRQLVGQAGLWAAIGLVFGDQSGWIGFSTNNGALLLSRRFSRDQEREADAFACDLMQRAKINPAGMVTFFETLQKKENENPALSALLKTLSLGSTHPDTAARIEAMRQKQPPGPPPDGWSDSTSPFRALRLSLGIVPPATTGETPALQAK